MRLTRIVSFIFLALNFYISELKRVAKVVLYLLFMTIFNERWKCSTGYLFIVSTIICIAYSISLKATRRKSRNLCRWQYLYYTHK